MRFIGLAAAAMMLSVPAVAQNAPSEAGAGQDPSTKRSLEDSSGENASGDAQPVEQSADIEAGEKIYRNVCRNCHGPKAQGMASFPGLAGLDPAYLKSRLAQYKAGEKVGPNSPIMYPVAQDLSDEDIANVSAFLAETFE